MFWVTLDAINHSEEKDCNAIMQCMWEKTFCNHTIINFYYNSPNTISIKLSRNKKIKEKKNEQKLHKQPLVRK